MAEGYKKSTFDYAKTANMDVWLRHPVLGDPSFDTFEKLGETVHKSEPPYEWGVNGSLFRDPVYGIWYYFAGIYPYGYSTAQDANGRIVCSDFKIYRSSDEGKSWEDLGKGFPDGFCFDGYNCPADSHPDTFMTYDPDTKLYWLAYDWATNQASWETSVHPAELQYNAGGALAYSQSPAGPFIRLAKPMFGNYEISRKLGRFTRAYLTTVFKRRSDWIALVLCDSGDRYSWGLVCMTADSPDGEWSDPTVVLSVDREEYYPAPVEFSPCFAVGDTVYAPATSVALNRNYQTMHTAPIEKAHIPEAWTLSGDGNAWHARNLSDEKYGIWGQTYNGFENDGTFTVMYPSRDERGFGTLSVAQRMWDKPHSDGFTFSGHAGKSISPLMRGYKNFTLEAEFTFAGTVEFAFDYNGILGPERSTSDSFPSKETFSNYKALRLSDGNFKFISVNQSGEETILVGGEYISDGGNIKMALQTEDNCVKFNINGKTEVVSNITVKGGLTAVIAHEFSILTCSKYEICAADGEQIPGTLKYHAYDAILGAGQRMADWKQAAHCISGKAVMNSVGQNQIYGKWNCICKGFSIYAPKAPTLGKMRVVVDGVYKSTVDLYAETEITSAPIYTCELDSGRHGIALYPENGTIVLDIIEVYL